MSDSPNTIDELMDRDPLQLTSQDIDAIIAYHRKARASANGKRPKKDSGPAPDLTELLTNLGAAPVAAPTIRRR